MNLSRSARDEAKRHLIAILQSERNDDLGNLEADILLDRISKEIGWLWFNEGIRTARAQLVKDFGALEERLDLLEELPPRKSKGSATSNR